MNHEAFLGKVIDGRPRGIRESDLQKKGEDIRIQGLSGKSEIIYTSDGSSKFSLKDQKDDRYRIHTDIKGFLVQNIIRSTVVLDNQRIRHPDLFANQLMRYFLQRVELETDKDKMVICEHWYVPDTSENGIYNELSDNYDEYTYAINVLGLSKTEAAISTWSGKLYSSLGFTIKDKDIQEENPCFIVVKFRR